MQWDRLLVQRIESWALSKGIHVAWGKEVIRLSDRKDFARAVISFDQGFWDEFAECSESQRQSVIEMIFLDADLQYDAAWQGQDAKDIAIPIAYIASARFTSSRIP